MDWLLNTLLKQSRLDADMVVFQRAPVAVDDLVRAALRPFLLSFELHSITLKPTFHQGPPGWETGTGSQRPCKTS